MGFFYMFFLHRMIFLFSTPLPLTSPFPATQDKFCAISTKKHFSIKFLISAGAQVQAHLDRRVTSSPTKTSKEPKRIFFHHVKGVWSLLFGRSQETPAWFVLFLCCISASFLFIRLWVFISEINALPDAQINSP